MKKKLCNRHLNLTLTYVWPVAPSKPQRMTSVKVFSALSIDRKAQPAVLAQIWRTISLVAESTVQSMRKLVPTGSNSCELFKPVPWPAQRANNGRKAIITFVNISRKQKCFKVNYNCYIVLHFIVQIRQTFLIWLTRNFGLFKFERTRRFYYYLRLVRSIYTCQPPYLWVAKLYKWGPIMGTKVQNWYREK